MSGFPNISQEQINKIKDSFQLIDQDNDGNITRNDLQIIHQSLGTQLSDGQFKSMTEIAGTDLINFTKYISILSNELKDIPSKNEIQEALEVFSKDMEINVKELYEGLKNQGMKQEEIDHVVSRFKTEKMNGDQIFRGDEFLSYMTS
ncbi:hypothetical protein WICMUC_005481 [Wickerhamomyces mucosus]|uniref:EF-hand domain-containing protein n=1 Tax=Wickerhamomyces mucosus TaxID=1378264 RepID=A0A9P8T5T1_9ASCO|nr:hypothetical protein WICMUC_005481 [Wickerhamomyces mucosus]